MPVSKKQQACVNRYTARHYDRINLTVPKGARDKIAAACGTGESVNAFIRRAINELLKREKKEPIE